GVNPQILGCFLAVSVAAALIIWSLPVPGDKWERIHARVLSLNLSFSGDMGMYSCPCLTLEGRTPRDRLFCWRVGLLSDRGRAATRPSMDLVAQECSLINLLKIHLCLFHLPMPPV